MRDVVVLALGIIDTTEIAKIVALTALVADFRRGEGLGEVRNGFFWHLLGKIDVAEIAEMASPCLSPISSARARA